VTGALGPAHFLQLACYAYMVRDERTVFTPRDDAGAARAAAATEFRLVNALTGEAWSVDADHATLGRVVAALLWAKFARDDEVEDAAFTAAHARPDAAVADTSAWAGYAARTDDDDGADAGADAGDEPSEAGTNADYDGDQPPPVTGWRGADE
jgi:hypothetical protein